MLLCSFLFFCTVFTLFFSFFFFNDTATTEIYTLSLHDALPISFCLADQQDPIAGGALHLASEAVPVAAGPLHLTSGDRKSTRLNSSHLVISYAVFCLKKKKKKTSRPMSRSVENSTLSPLSTTLY